MFKSSLNIASTKATYIPLIIYRFILRIFICFIIKEWKWINSYAIVCFRHSIITNLYLEDPLDLVPVNNKTYIISLTKLMLQRGPSKHLTFLVHLLDDYGMRVLNNNIYKTKW